MQILSVSADHYASNRNYLNQMHRLRAAVFGTRLEWDVTITEQGERDQYDDLRPTYILAISTDQKVVGCARLLPASGPTMLEQTFAQLLERGSLDPHAAMVESSRFCVDTSLQAGRRGSLHQVTLTMFAGIIEWSMANGYSEIVTATDLRFERLFPQFAGPFPAVREEQRRQGRGWQPADLHLAPTGCASCGEASLAACRSQAAPMKGNAGSMSRPVIVGVEFVNDVEIIVSFDFVADDDAEFIAGPEQRDRGHEGAGKCESVRLSECKILCHVRNLHPERVDPARWLLEGPGTVAITA